MDETALRGMLGELARPRPSPARRTRARAKGDDGTTSGTWNRGGAAHLASEIVPRAEVPTVD